MNIHLSFKSITYINFMLSHNLRENRKREDTVILGQKTTCFDVKLLLADLLFEPELQVGPVAATNNNH